MPDWNNHVGAQEAASKHIIWIFTFFIVVLFFSASPYKTFSQSANKKSSNPVRVIFDTDIGPDYDDVGAMAMLHALADSGECTILATIASNKHRYIASVLDILNIYFNRPDLPIGVVRGNAVDLTAIQKWDSMIVSNYPHKLRSNDQAADALDLYRKILASQPDRSVTIVTVGFLTNMANLLQSAPDKWSPLSGEELVKRKVKLLVSMAACFDHRMGSFKEFNVVRDAASSKIAFDNWPTPILLSGFEIGVKIFTGLPIINNEKIHHSPVKDVFARSIPLDPADKNGRMSWDETAVLVAIRGYERYFDAVQGKIICHKDGSNSWDPTGKRDKYLVHKMPANEIEKILNGLIMHQPVPAH